MKAPRFAYARPASVAEALALLAEHKDEARVLAGGQSLVPMLNFRVAAPKVLVDINRIAGLSGIKVTKDKIRIGALTRHVELERSADIARHLPLIASAMPHIAHPAIRNRGTFGGSCALADPAAELPACATALAPTTAAIEFIKEYRQRWRRGADLRRVGDRRLGDRGQAQARCRPGLCVRHRRPAGERQELCHRARIPGACRPLERPGPWRTIAGGVHLGESARPRAAQGEKTDPGGGGPGDRGDDPA